MEPLISATLSFIEKECRENEKEGQDVKSSISPFHKTMMQN